MRARDYRILGELLYAECQREIEDFAGSQENRDVYALCLYCDPDNGSYSICLNTEAAFRRRVRETYRDYPEERLAGFLGVKYSPADFAFFGVGPGSPALRAACGRYQDHLERLDDEARCARHQARFVDQAVLAIERLREDLTRLDRTADFIAYASLHDADEQTRVALCRRTVPADVFARVFPDVIEREQLHERLAKRPTAEQVDFWARAVEALTLRREPEPAARGLGEFEALATLKALGPLAVPAMLDLIERYAGHPEWTVPGSKESAEFGAFTRESWLAGNLLLALIDIGHADDDLHERLTRLLRGAYAANRTAAISGLLPSLSARALHRLFPQRYPAPRVSESKNHLLNAAAFGLE